MGVVPCLERAQPRDFVRERLAARGIRPRRGEVTAALWAELLGSPLPVLSTLTCPPHPQFRLAPSNRGIAPRIAGKDSRASSGAGELCGAAAFMLGLGTTPPCVGSKTGGHDPFSDECKEEIQSCSDIGDRRAGSLARAWLDLEPRSRIHRL